MSSWGSIQVGFDNKEKLADLIKVADKSKMKKHKSYRYVGDVYSYRCVWMPIYSKGKRLVGPKGPVNIPKFLTNYDMEKQESTDDVCPYQELAKKMNEVLDKENQINESTSFIGNAISREAQEDPPRKLPPPTKKEAKSGFKDIESKTWTPVEAVDMTATWARKIKGLEELNVVKMKGGEKKAFPIDHEKYGIDVQLKYDPNEKGTAKYDAQKGDRTPLTDEEKEYLKWDILSALKSLVDTPKEAKKEADRLWAEFLKANKKSKKSKDDDDEEEEDADDLEDDEDEDEKPSKSKKKKKKDDDSDDSDDDEKPSKSKKKKSDDDDDDDDDEDEEKTVKKKKKKSKSSDDDDDEDDKALKVKKKKKKKSDDDDDDDDEELPF